MGRYGRRRSYGPNGYISMADRVVQRASGLNRSNAYWALVKKGSPDGISIFGKSEAEANPVQKNWRALSGYHGEGRYYRNRRSYRRPRFRRAYGGRGDYTSRMNRFFGRVRDTASQVVGTGRHLAGLAGYGDYSAENPEAALNGQANQIVEGSGQTPLTVNATDDLSGDIVLCHREFIQNITVLGGSGNVSAYAIQSFPINPGMAQTFPFLSQIAQNFTMYELEGTVFEYIPTSGEYGGANSNALGKVIMATNYDPDAPLFVTSQQMENYDYAISGKPAIKLIHGVETKNSQMPLKMFYIRSGTTAKDKAWTDIGLFQIATEGIPQASATTGIIGELWVTYKVRLSRAQLYGTTLGANIECDAFWAYATAGNLVAGTAAQLPLEVPSTAENVNPAKYLSNGLFQAASKLTNSIGGNVTSSSTTNLVYNFPPSIAAGTYLVCLWIRLGAAAAVSAAAVGYGTQLQILSNTSTPQGGVFGRDFAYVNSAAGTSFLSLSFGIQVNNPTQLPVAITFALTGTVGASTRTFLSVSQVSSACFQ